MESPPEAVPVQQAERITAIDALRGFALLGILIMNIKMFAGPFSQYANPHAYEPAGGTDTGSWLVFLTAHVLADLKMMAIFSMLFGAGIVIMGERQKAKGLGAAGTHYRRMGWLFLFGLIHAYLIWAGDILFLYAFCGLFAFLARRWFVPIQFAIGGLLLIMGSLIMLGSGLSIDLWPDADVQAMVESWAPSQETLDEELAAYRGSWIDQMDQRVPMSLGWQTGGLVFFGFWRAAGLMLLGMGLYRLGVFSARRSTRFYLILIALGAIIGVPLILWGAQRNIDDGWLFETAFFLNSQFNYIGSVFVALGWIGVIMLLVKLGILKLLIHALTAVGQMAFTNYLMQSIICTTIFYGHGLGLFGEMTYLEQFYIVLGVWAVELIWSPLWLSKFRFGPFEWLWRSLTYWRPQPMLRT